jgi:6-pyruvoyltetrahydropterin/6-carboxytetrahydropterin synthase
MYELTIHATFNATHALRLPDGTREPSHGHDWQVQAAVAAPRLDEHEWVMDFHQLETSLQSIVKPMHHTALDDHAVIGARNPTAERVAKFIADELAKQLPAAVSLRRVSITEAPGCIATWRSDNR